MFTTDSGYNWQATPKRLGSVWMGDREVILSERGITDLADRLAQGQPQDDAIKAIILRDFSHDVMGWWSFVGRRNPLRMIGRIQICRTVEYGKARYTATSVLTDHTSTTLTHLLGRLTRMQFGSRSKAKVGAKNQRQTRRQPVLSDGEVWARRHEEGWGPGGY